jgi:hypothetical protein
MMFNDTVNNISIILWQIFFLLYRFLHMTVNKNQQKYSLPSTIKHYLYECLNKIIGEDGIKNNLDLN